MTELADTLTREEGLSFKMAHRLVGGTARRLGRVDASHEEIVATLLVVAEEVLGQPLRTSRERLVEALCPLHFVTVRDRIGGPAPNQVAAFLGRIRESAGEDQRWLRQKRALLEGYPRKIAREVARLTTS
jgi:argininosuccinate lyase